MLDELMREDDPEFLKRHYSSIRRDIRGKVYAYARLLRDDGVPARNIAILTEDYVRQLAQGGL